MENADAPNPVCGPAGGDCRMVPNVHAAEACAYSIGSAWTATGGGVPAQLVVLGGETCQGNIRWPRMQIIAPPQHGKVRITGPSTYVYTPNRAYRGPDEFRVSATDSTVGLVIGIVEIMVQ